MAKHRLSKTCDTNPCLTIRTFTTISDRKNKSRVKVLNIPNLNCDGWSPNKNYLKNLVHVEHLGKRIHVLPRLPTSGCCVLFSGEYGDSPSPPLPSPLASVCAVRRDQAEPATAATRRRSTAQQPLQPLLPLLPPLHRLSRLADHRINIRCRPYRDQHTALPTRRPAGTPE